MCGVPVPFIGLAMFFTAKLLQRINAANYQSSRRTRRLLVCPYWGPEFESRYCQRQYCSGQCHGFAVFIQVLPSHKFQPTNILHFSIFPLHVISYSHSFISCHPFSDSWLGNILQHQNFCTVGKNATQLLYSLHLPFTPFSIHVNDRGLLAKP